MRRSSESDTASSLTCRVSIWSSGTWIENLHKDGQKAQIASQTPQRNSTHQCKWCVSWVTVLRRKHAPGPVKEGLERLIDVITCVHHVHHARSVVYLSVRAIPDT